MTFSILFVANNRIQIDILHTSENITLDKWVRLFQCPDQLLISIRLDFVSSLLQVVQVSVNLQAH